MQKTRTEVIRSCFLFQNLTDADLEFIESKFTERQYKKGDIIFGSINTKPELGIVISGEVVVYQKGVLLNSISPGGIFGVSALFSKEESFLTEVVAKHNSVVVFLPFEILLELISSNNIIALNYISFLSDKIVFLNKRIADLAASSAEDKVLDYLAKMSKDNLVEVSSGYTSLASSLNIGRTSLYRVLDGLEASGKITRNGKIITLH